MFLSKQVSQTTKMEARKDFMDRALLKMGESWKKALNSEFNKKYFIELREYVEMEYRSHMYRGDTPIYPSPEHVFSWTRHCRIQDVKVVILGQDPYHKPGEAHGLCFSVPKGVKKPRSLQNIFKELKSDIPGFKIPDDGDLTKWAKQGVLLLNSVLTVREGEPNSHKNQGWEIFTDAVIKWISSNLENVVFMLWGVDAQEKDKKDKGDDLIKKTKGHEILKAAHPSPLSVEGFTGCRHFFQANQHLKCLGKNIDWKL